MAKSPATRCRLDAPGSSFSHADRLRPALNLAAIHLRKCRAIRSQCARPRGRRAPRLGAVSSMILVSCVGCPPGSLAGRAKMRHDRSPWDRAGRAAAGRAGGRGGLVTEPHRRLAGEPQPQLPADLLRAPPLRQQLGDQLPQLAAGLDPPPVAAGPPRELGTPIYFCDSHSPWQRGSNEGDVALSREHLPGRLPAGIAAVAPLPAGTAPPVPAAHRP
jgi:hypothetical protein